MVDVAATQPFRLNCSIQTIGGNSAANAPVRYYDSLAYIGNGFAERVYVNTSMKDFSVFIAPSA